MGIYYLLLVYMVYLLEEVNLCHGAEKDIKSDQELST